MTQMNIDRISPSRTNFKGVLSPAEIDTLISDKNLEVLQTDCRINSKTCVELNQNFFTIRPEVELRVYGHYLDVCDLKFLTHFTNLRRFTANGLQNAVNAEFIESLTQLRSLTVGIFNLDNFDFLGKVPSDDLVKLGLEATRSKKPRLRDIHRFSEVKELYLEGQSKDIEVISQLTKLEKLTLRSITVPNLKFLRVIPSLWSLEIKLGGIRNLQDLAFLKGIRYLELWLIRGLKDLSPISEMTGLQFLHLQALRNVKSLPDLSRLSSLRQIYLEDMKGLEDLSSLETAPALEELMHVSAEGKEPSHYVRLIKGGILKELCVGFGSARKNTELKQIMDDAGILECQSNSLQFILKGQDGTSEPRR